MENKYGENKYRSFVGFEMFFFRSMSTCRCAQKHIRPSCERICEEGRWLATGTGRPKQFRCPRSIYLLCFLPTEDLEKNRGLRTLGCWATEDLVNRIYRDISTIVASYRHGCFSALLELATKKS